VGHVLGQFAELAGVHVEFDPLHILEGHDQLLQGGVTRALPEAVHRSVDEPRSGFDAGDGVGGGHAEVIVGMHLDIHAGDVDDGLDLHEGIEGIHDPQRVTEAQAIRSGITRRAGKREQELHIGARGVLGVDRNVEVVALGELHRRLDALQDPLAVGPQLVLYVDIGRGHRDGHGIHATIE